MEDRNCNLSVFFFISLAVMIPALHAHIGEFDEYWQQREKVARNAAQQSYHHNPWEVTNHLNMKVGEAIKGSNGTRRNLGKYIGECMAINPIDKCWRCRPDWEENRKLLSECVLGFGHKTTGGTEGEIYVVTDPSDDSLTDPKPGTLRHAVTREEPLWIIFQRSMFITLKQELLVTSHKTIDARGANVHISHGAGITLQYVENVIIHGLHIHDIIPGDGGNIISSASHTGMRTKSDGDAISIFGSSNIWIDHVSLTRAADGLVDAIMGSTAITISNCHLAHHNETMLFGASDEHKNDTIMQITVAFNHFGKGLVQRMPRCRFGFFHVVNNDYTHWLMYAIGGSSHPTVVSQGNRFIAPPDPNAKEVTKRIACSEQDSSSWQWRSEGDLMMNGAYFVESGQPLDKGHFSTEDMIPAEPGTSVSALTRVAGPLHCTPHKPC